MVSTATGNLLQFNWSSWKVAKCWWQSWHSCSSSKLVGWTVMSVGRSSSSHAQLEIVHTLLVVVILLGCVALGAPRPIVIKLSPWTICRCVGLSSALWKNGGSDPDALWHRRSDGSRDEAGSGGWRSVYGKGYFCGRISGAPL